MTTIKLNFDSIDKILGQRKLNENDEAQRFLTSEVARLSNPYTPFKTGNLKDIQVQVLPNKIKYNAPYAAKQYYNNAGMGKQGLNNGGLRGKRWCDRMWIDKGDAIVKSVARFVGGRTK